MKKMICVLCCLGMLILSATSSFAAKGDYFELSQKKFYKMPHDRQVLLQDLKMLKENPSAKFFVELANGMYVDASELRIAQLKALTDLFVKNDITSDQEIENFMERNIEEVFSAIEQAQTEVPQKKKEELLGEETEYLEVLSID